MIFSHREHFGFHIGCWLNQSKLSSYVTQSYVVVLQHAVPLPSALAGLPSESPECLRTALPLRELRGCDSGC